MFNVRDFYLLGPAMGAPMTQHDRRPLQITHDPDSLRPSERARRTPLSRGAVYFYIHGRSSAIRAFPVALFDPKDAERYTRLFGAQQITSQAGNGGTHFLALCASLGGSPRRDDTDHTKLPRGAPTILDRRTV